MPDRCGRNTRVDGSASVGARAPFVRDDRSRGDPGPALNGGAPPDLIANTVERKIIILERGPDAGKGARRALTSDVKGPGVDPRMISNETQISPIGAVPDDLLRDVYCILGIPVDAIGLPDVLSRVRAAAASRTPFLISTPNLNFLVSRQTDSDFRESLLQSDLCPADGMAIVWVAKLMGIPVTRRVPGSDIFDALKAEHRFGAPLNVFLFGGAEGVAAAATRALNSQPLGLYCVGSLYPGFGSVDEMSRDDIIETVNSSGADLLVVALGAKKGQSWLLRNHNRLHVAVRAHLGATVNFQAGSVKRAPQFMQRLNLEWLWRIKEEPQLWRRYWNDGCVLLRLLLTRVLPIAVWNWRLQPGTERQDLVISLTQDDESVVLRLAGPATSHNVEKAVPAFRRAIATNKRVVIDFSGAPAIDARFLGLLLMLNKKLKNVGESPVLIGLSPGLERLFRLHGVEFLLSRAQSAARATHPPAT